MERKSEFMDWNLQYYINFILTKLIYVIPAGDQPRLIQGIRRRDG